LASPRVSAATPHPGSASNAPTSGKGSSSMRSPSSRPARVPPSARSVTSLIETAAYERLLLHCDAQRVRRNRLGRILLVEDIDLLDAEACVADQRDDRTIQVAAAEDLLLKTVETVLPALHLLVRCETVLDEVQGAS